MEMDGDVSRSTPGNGVMSAASGVKTSMGIGYDVCGEERESEGGESGQEAHLW